jgi:hypothetical protein
MKKWVAALLLTVMSCAQAPPSWERVCRLMDANPAELAPPKVVWLKDEAAVSQAHFWLTGQEKLLPAFYCRQNHTIYTCALETLPHEYAHAVSAQSGKQARLSRQQQETLAKWVEREFF